MGWGFGVWRPWPSDFSWLIHLCAEVKRNVLWSFALATITIQSAWSALAEATGDWSGWCGRLFGYKLRSKHALKFAFHCSSRFDLFQHFQPVAEELFQDSPPKEVSTRWNNCPTGSTGCAGVKLIHFLPWHATSHRIPQDPTGLSRVPCLTRMDEILYSVAATWLNEVLASKSTIIPWWMAGIC